ncbi:hypothetical protein M422DRAFT_207452 [Sphaerobolus stellatus SS14]|uniref:MYND-type domain-containing protein n=1 Tax=Sphaerobolus stellatus (strain SS14) TaxID=990650 RepID=A0A0C9W127_SPHS4|nr:hypothetical protein M422DRAFT_207452 [Sphaerobolus stellatus SS14]
MVVHFQEEYEHAAALKEGKEGLDFSEIPECGHCHNEDPKCLLCGACRAILYCSADCAKSNWADKQLEQDAGIAPGHRIMCHQNKDQMEKVAEFQAILKQFPWARLENDGTFRSKVLLASRGLLGTGKEFGYWSEEPCCDEHGLTAWEWGISLMQSDLPDEKAGWKLPDEEIPWLTFNEEHKPPAYPPTFEDNWKSYYEWRGLPLSSPAALLLHWPLTVYSLLKQLKLVPKLPTDLSDSVATSRRSLLIHYLGVEEELDYLPVFSELAFLFPNTDIELIFFGEPAYTILHSGKKFSNNDNPSIISKSKDDIVHTYTAPESLGGGSIRLLLWGGGPKWTPDVLRFGAPFPDAIVGLNAGLAAYVEWQSAIVASRAFGIPFAVTEFMEASVALDKVLVNGLTADLPDDANEWMKETYGEEGAGNLRLKHGMPSTMNPFMRPGQKTGGAWSRLPAAINGFTLVVMPNVRNPVE